MYIVKNAMRCISRSKGRNVLIGIIVLVIAISSCLGLSIRQAAESAREDTLGTMSVTGTISFDRTSMMSGMRNPGEMGGTSGGGFDRESFSEMMGQSSSLTLEEYKKYAEAESVDDFYYTLTAYFNGGEGLDPVSSETETEEETEESTEENDFGGMGGMPGRMPGGMFQMAENGDFTVVGYSAESAMTRFVEGTASITDGVVFDEGTEEYQCIISEELAVFNDLAVGDTIIIVNANSDEETYTLTVTGIYTDTSANENSFGNFGSLTMSDPANKIYMSAAALQNIADASESVSETVTDEDTGREFETKLSATLSGTYVFTTPEAYYEFEEEVYELGLSDSYTVSSPDITAFENSLVPLETLSTMAGYFLLVILAIGAIILIVLNIFSVRERKYEIGVLTAMGMKKYKVAMQFLCEIFAVTMAAVIIGAAVGSVCSVPVTNALLENQINSQTADFNRIEEGFGRGEMPGGDIGGGAPDMPQGGFGNKGDMSEFFGSMAQGASDYITEVNSAVNLTVLWQMLGVAVLLTLAAGAASMLFIMRYEPLKILANRD